MILAVMLFIVLGICFALVAPFPPVISNTSLDGRRLDLQSTQQDTDFIEEYTVTVTTTPLGCEALVEDRVSTLDGLSRSLSVEELEEFSNITVVLVARNELGNASTAVVVTTISAGELGLKINSLYLHKYTLLCSSRKPRQCP